MNQYAAVRWAVFASCLFLKPSIILNAEEPPSDATAVTAAEHGGAGAGGNRLTVRIELDDTQGGGAIDVDKPLRIVLTNISKEPISIHDPGAEEGYYQLAFQFTNLKSGEKRAARKAVVPSEMFSAKRASEMITILPGDSLTRRESFGGIWGEYRTWTGLPDPNSADRFSVIAIFESTARPNAEKKQAWSGRTQSKPLAASFVAPRLKTPLDYLWSGYPDKAIELMSANPAWITARGEDQCTPLHHAARFGYLGAVQWLLEHGADANALAYNGFTALHLADDPEVIELILRRRPDLTIRCRAWDQTPLQHAAEALVDARSLVEKKRWREIVELYRRAGADYDLQTAIYLDDLERVKAILAESPGLADGQGSKGRTPLRAAASLGRLAICRYLIAEFKVDVSDFERGTGYPIIKEALAFPEIVGLLIDHGADLKTRITWRGGRTGIWLIGDDATTLHYAASDGAPETVRLLIDNGVDIFAEARTHESNRQTALEVAAIFGKAGNAAAIVTHPKFAAADREVRQALLDKCLRTAVVGSWLTDQAERPLLVKLLLEQGANPNASENGILAIQIAAQQIRPDDDEENRRIRQIIKLLRKHGASIDFFSAVAVGDEPEVARQLNDDPSLANTRGPDGYPALHFAVGMDCGGIVAALLAAGGDVDVRNRSQSTGYVDETALHCAAFWDRVEIAKLLINAGADVNALTDRKSTPLHDAARLGHARIAKLLLDHGADPGARDSKNQTPLDWHHDLSGYGSDEIEKVFREHTRR